MNKPIGPSNIGIRKISDTHTILILLGILISFIGISTCEVNTYKSKKECMGILIARLIEKGQPLQDNVFDRIEEKCKQYDR